MQKAARAGRCAAALGKKQSRLTWRRRSSLWLLVKGAAHLMSQCVLSPKSVDVRSALPSHSRVRSNSIRIWNLGMVKVQLKACMSSSWALSKEGNRVRGVIQSRRGTSPCWAWMHVCYKVGRCWQHSLACIPRLPAELKGMMQAPCIKLV